jgi:SAM-dependent methyltransferase
MLDKITAARDARTRVRRWKEGRQVGGLLQAATAVEDASAIPSERVSTEPRVIHREGPRPPALEAFLDRLASLVPGGRALEVGSGTGSDADRLEELGLQVERTDATPAFIEMQREAGHRARLLDARRDELGGPFDAVLSIAALHHLTREELESFLAKARAAVPRGGVLAVTLKEGDGGAWSDAKLGQPRYFVYWREPNLRDMVTRAGWKVLSLDHIEGREPWLFLLARRDDVEDLAPSDT